MNDPDFVAVLASDKALSETQSFNACERMIKKEANYPSRVKINRLTASYKKFEQLGNTRVMMDFKSKNAFG